MREIIPRTLVGADQARVMRLGDSITVGLAYYGGMVKRYPGIQWVGSQLAGAPLSPNADGPHEGHGGWSTVGVLQHIDEWLAAAKPTIVLLMIGTNDIGSKFPLNQVTDRLEQIATKIAKTGAQLAIATIPPLKQWKPEIDVKPYNDFIINLVDKLSKLGYNVSLVDVGWDVSDISSDNLHPNPKGYKKFADAYAKVLEGKTYPKPSIDSTTNSTPTQAASGGIQLGKAALGAAAVLGIYRWFF